MDTRKELNELLRFPPSVGFQLHVQRDQDLYDNMQREGLHMPCNRRQAGTEGGTQGMVGGMKVGFEVLSVAYGYCWAGCAGKIMLAKATWLPDTTPSFSMVRNVL